MNKLYTFYKIFSKDNKYIYVGSTTDFKKRKRYHKEYCNKINSKKYNFKIYKTIRENGGWDNFLVEKIEDKVYANKTEALIRENELMKQLNCNLNTYKSYLTHEEKILQKKDWAIANKEKQNTTNICDCGGKFATTNKARHFQSKKHKAFDKQTINHITNNYNTTNNYNITNLTINK